MVGRGKLNTLEGQQQVKTAVTSDVSSLQNSGILKPPAVKGQTFCQVSLELLYSSFSSQIQIFQLGRKLLETQVVKGNVDILGQGGTRHLSEKLSQDRE